MKKDEVPQDKAKAFMGRSKALYAVDEKGHYGIVPSNGWEAEEIVLDQAIEEFQERCNDAWQRAKEGQASPLEYHMFKRRMDVVVLAESTGFFQWQVRRHLRPGKFQSLSESKKLRYAQALNMPLPEIEILPEKP
jgi:hypothetical protein